MIAELQCVVLDCPDPALLARFYAELLGGTADRPDGRWALSEEWATVHTPTGFVLCFQRVQGYRPPQWPDPAHPQQSHLDFGVADLDRATELVLGLGAALLNGGPDTRGWRIFADPAGHPFCLVRH